MATQCDNIVKFPRTVEMIERDMEKIANQSLDILQRSESLLRWAEEELCNEQLYPRRMDVDKSKR